MMGEKEGLTPMVVLSALLATLGPLTFGFSLGFTSPASQQLTGEECYAGCSLVLSTSQLSTVGAVINVGAMAGAALGAVVADQGGRTRTLVLACLPFLVGSLCTAAASSFAALVLGRALSGVGAGLVSLTAPVYLAEIAPTRLRGVLGSMNQLAVVIGILLAYVLGLRAFELGWRNLALVGVLPSATLLLSGLLWLPETPRWLCAANRPEAAREVLRKLRGTPNVHVELAHIQKAVSASADEPKATIADLLAPGMRTQMCIGCGMLMLQQFSGINAVVFYSADILKDAGIDDAEMGALGVGLVQVLATVVCCQLIDRSGRRTLIFVSTAGMAASTSLLAVYFHYKEDISSRLATVLSAGSLMAYMVTFSLGLGAIPWVLMSEIFPAHARGLASSVATLASWSSSFVVTQVFKGLMETITPAGVFLCCTMEIIFTFVFVMKFVPETKGLTLEQIEAYFKTSGRGKQNCVITPFPARP